MEQARSFRTRSTFLLAGPLIKQYEMEWKLVPSVIGIQVRSAMKRPGFIITAHVTTLRAWEGGPVAIHRGLWMDSTSTSIRRTTPCFSSIQTGEEQNSWRK